MADQQDSQERTEQPTPKRLADARRKGQIARSRELTTMLVLFGGAAALFLSGRYTMGGLTGIMTESFQLSHAEVFAPGLVEVRFLEIILAALGAIAPLLVAATAVALAAPLALGGWSLSGEALLPKLERVDPLKGLKRVFGAKGLMEGAKAFAKFVLIIGFALAALYAQQDAILALGRGDVNASLSASTSILFGVFLVASGATILVALIDVPFQLWQHNKQLRMSHRELKDEMKETDGSPELKSRVRALQQEVSRRRMMEAVPEADVVVTNPEHYAVALKFDPDTMAAPVVVAKGVDEVARNIRELASRCGVTRVSAPPLARALYYSTKIDRQIPAGLYVAVAKVLAYVFQLESGKPVVLPADLPIPPDLRRGGDA